MLRNVITNRQFVNLRFSENVRRRSISLHHGALGAKDSNLGRQGKIISKLFGQRVSGSKKLWYPTHDSTATPTASSIFQATQIGKTSGGGGGKNTTRRMTVLNKLFMKHVTDLMATGAAGENIVGRGLQVTRCKTTKDFAYLNVYWLGCGDVLADQRLEQDLHRCSGLLRHELSQLRVMGEVPRINFVREKTYHNLAQVEAVLDSLDFGDEADEGHREETSHYPTSAAKQLREDFYGKTSREGEPPAEEAEANLPAMRHDVLGLDHRDIMSKIHAKMRKSKQAWSMHEQRIAPVGDGEEQLERIRRKIAEAEENADKFEKFLDKRRDRKNTPERKKYSRTEQLEELNAPSRLYASGNLERYESMREEEDFLHEDGDKYK